MDEAIITDENFQQLFSPQRQKEFWALVERVQRDVFDVDRELAKHKTAEYRRTVDASRPGGRMLAYHDDPLNVAADLAGIHIKRGHLVLYRKLLAAERGGIAEQALPGASRGQRVQRPIVGPRQRNRS